MPRKQGMERSDLLKANVGIFRGQGEALDKYAKKSVKVLVVGNPANTNAAVCSYYAPSIPKENFSALTRLDHNRATSLTARHLGVPLTQVEGVVIWGNHSGTQFADVTHAKVGGQAVLNDSSKQFFRGEFITTVQKRGAAVIAARKSSSAASAAKAIVDHVRDWHLGTGGRVVSMAIPSGAYQVPAGVIFSYPVRISDKGEIQIVEGLPIDEYSQTMLKKTYTELQEEWGFASKYLTNAKY
jgi:malate dehydrogenase